MLFSPNNIFGKFSSVKSTHTVFTDAYYSHCIDVRKCIHQLPTDGHLGGFQPSIVNKAQRKTVRHVNSSMYHIAGLIPRSRHAGQRPWTFVFDKYCLINFHTYGISLYSHHQWKVISLSSPQDSMLTVHMYKLFNVLIEIY